MEGGFLLSGEIGHTPSSHRPNPCGRTNGGKTCRPSGFQPLDAPLDLDEARVFRQEGGRQATHQPTSLLSFPRLWPKRVQSQVNAAPDETSRMATHRLAPSGGYHSLGPLPCGIGRAAMQPTMHCPIHGRAVLPCSPLCASALSPASVCVVAVALRLLSPSMSLSGVLGVPCHRGYDAMQRSIRGAAQHTPPGDNTSTSRRVTCRGEMAGGPSRSWCCDAAESWRSGGLCAGGRGQAAQHAPLRLPTALCTVPAAASRYCASISPTHN